MSNTLLQNWSLKFIALRRYTSWLWCNCLRQRKDNIWIIKICQKDKNNSKWQKTEKKIKNVSNNLQKNLEKEEWKGKYRRSERRQAKITEDWVGGEEELVGCGNHANLKRITQSLRFRIFEAPAVKALNSAGFSRCLTPAPWTFSYRCGGMVENVLSKQSRISDDVSAADMDLHGRAEAFGGCRTPAAQSNLRTGWLIQCQFTNDETIRMKESSKTIGTPPRCHKLLSIFLKRMGCIR